MLELATPVSHLFQSEDMASKINELSDCLECRDFTIENSLGTQKLFHCELQPIHHWTKDELVRIENIKKSKPDLELISFHMAACCDKPSLEGIWFELGGKVYDRDMMLQSCSKNFSDIRSILGDNIKIAVENNNYYPTPAYDNVTDADFINEVVEGNDLNFLFDISHAAVTSHNKNISFQDYINDLPVDRAIQIHLCSHGVRDDGLAYDAHEPPGIKEWDVVKWAYSKSKALKYITVEFYKDFNLLCETLKDVRSKADELFR